MNNVKIKALTAIHIGSGETLMYGNDFVEGSDDGGEVLSIIDPQKVLNIIGEKNIDKWVASIDSFEPTNLFLKKIAPNVSYEDYSKRVIALYCPVRQGDTLKELIHDGQGRPYIPGSSIKGAIRTAILSTLVDNNSEYLIANDRNISARKIEKRIFGNDPNSDFLRFLQVGDAIFGSNYEIAIKMVNINERERNGFWDKSKPQIIEAICAEDESTFKLSIKQDQYNLASRYVHSLPECLKDESTLFNIINTNSIDLINKEIDYWEKREEKDKSDAISKYLEQLQSIRESCNSCVQDKECILRIGHGSGWRFITGDWSRTFSCFKNKIVPASRPKNERYVQFDFPKSRRVNTDCELLGFVKLTLN
jgi:CRISPR-associated protein Csm5